MKLSDYMKLVGKTDAQIGELVGRDRTTVARWRQGKTRPDWEALAKLDEVSSGVVKASDFYHEEPAQ